MSPSRDNLIRAYGAEELPVSVQRRLKAAAITHGKAVVLGPVFDTIKRIEDGLVVETLDRDQLRQPLAWACTRKNEPVTDPPSADWFVGAAIVE